MYAYKLDSNPEPILDTATHPPALATQIIGYLRWAGTGLIVISAIGFMLQSRADLLPAYRYWIGLGLTLLLCAGGMICRYGLKETTGARIFFALGVAFLPVQVSQVSAMLYAFSQGSLALQLPYHWLQFGNVSPSLIAADFIITVLLLVLVGYAGFAMLARRQVKRLLQALLLGSFLLLLPVRDAYWPPVLITLLFFALRAVEQQLRQDSTLRLGEGLTARVLLSLPLLILIGRSLLHPASCLLGIVLALITAVICILDLKHYTKSASIIDAGQFVGTLAALLAWLNVTDTLLDLGYQNYGLLLPAALLLFILSVYVDRYSATYRLLGAVLACGLITGSLLDGQAFAPLLALATGLSLSVVGLRYHEKVPFFAGHLCCLGGVLFYCGYAIDAYQQAPWLSTIGLGLAVLLAASYLEKRQQHIIRKVDAYWHELQSWG
jgi:hypothetical protein